MASISNPSRVLTRMNSVFPSLYCPSVATRFSSITRTRVPSEACRRTCVGVLTSLQPSMKYEPVGLKLGRWLPSASVSRLRPLPSSLTR
jgi:hypothetical protein